MARLPPSMLAAATPIPVAPHALEELPSVGQRGGWELDGCCICLHDILQTGGVSVTRRRSADKGTLVTMNETRDDFTRSR
jgi:hypothetical protein